ncbi:MAG: Gfo/Idh/MocA family oxidoreductase [Promethearchaeota archaeon]
MAKEVKVGILGYAFMGRAHSNAYNQAPIFHPDVAAVPVKQVACGRTAEPLAAFARQFGWRHTETSWEAMLKRDDVDLFDNSGPNNVHKDPVIAAAEAGKHVFCEKPLAMNLDEAREMVRAVERTGVVNMCAYNYRRVPAIGLAKRLIEEGRLGRIYHFRATYLQDWIVDPNFPLVWRLRKEICGSGPHGDLNAHIVDVALHLVGKITRVVGMDETFIKQRPVVAGAKGISDRGEGGAQQMGEVTVDDTTAFLAKFENGAVGTFEATRFATGRKNYHYWEINGSKGSIYFNLERMNELNFLDASEPEAGFRTIMVTEAHHPHVGNWWPPGHVIGWEHTHVFQVVDLLNAIGTDDTVSPTLREGAEVQAVLQAVTDSIASGGWENVQSV